MKIFIDAGHNHSGWDTGAQGNGLREQDINYEVAAIVSQKLRDLGIEVKQSRPEKTTNVGNDLNSSLSERVRMANQWHADYFISIHCNSFSSPEAIGSEVYIIAKGGDAEKLAEDVLENVVQTVHTVDRGVKVQNLYVLRNTDMPAILVELAFISSPSDAKLLETKQEQFAEGIVNGVAQYLQIDKEDGTLTREEAIEILKQKAGLEDQTIFYLECYRYSDDLIKKLAEAILA